MDYILHSQASDDGLKTESGNTKTVHRIHRIESDWEFFFIGFVIKSTTIGDKPEAYHQCDSGF